METYFLITNFEQGYHQEEFIYEEVLLEYCEMALEIPLERIESVEYHNDTIEISLFQLTSEDTSDDWYVNLYKTAKR